MGCIDLFHGNFIGSPLYVSKLGVGSGERERNPERDPVLSRERGCPEDETDEE